MGWYLQETQSIQKARLQDSAGDVALALRLAASDKTKRACIPSQICLNTVGASRTGAVTATAWDSHFLLFFLNSGRAFED
jgi:hypothetical protein